MTLPSSGAISLSAVNTEFGGSTPIGLKTYYRGGGYVPNTSNNSGVATSGAINMNSFHSASAFLGFTTPTSLYANGVTYGVDCSSGGVYCVVGGYYTSGPTNNNAAFWLSSNGTTWGAPTTLLNSSTKIPFLSSVAWNQTLGVFIAVGQDGNNNGVIYTITTGGTATLQATISNFFISCVAVNSSGLTVVAGQYSSLIATVYSSNGTTWTSPVTISGTGSSPTLYALTVNPAGYWSGVGAYFNVGPSAQTPIFISSSNGTSFTGGSMGVPPATSGVIMAGVVWNAKLNQFVAIGSYGPSYYSLSNSTGSTWAVPSLASGTYGVNLGGKGSSCLAINAAGLMISAAQNGSADQGYFKSTNGTTWTYTLLVTSQVNSFLAIACNANTSQRYIAVGANNINFSVST